jgi:CubicO group peptidase (beta-lactamase class C family)
MWMRLALLVVVMLTLVPFAQAAEIDAGTVYPDKAWRVAASPSEVGWSAEKLAEARKYTEGIDTAAVMVVHKGVVVAQWGDVDAKYPCESMRKSLLSAMIGMEVAKGTIRPDATMAELGIDDLEPSLTDEEKLATVGDLLTARSGVYHPAAYEPSSMARNRPARGSSVRGETFFYNNWDFNTLGTIFTKAAGGDLFAEFEKRIAGPIGMQDFTREDGRYMRANTSEHPAYLFNLSARDLARFGLLYARGGRWGQEQIVPEAWVRESTRAHVAGEKHPYGGFGYMWWTAKPDTLQLFGVTTEEGAFAAAGSGGHRVVVLPKSDIVIVHRIAAMNTLSKLEVTPEQFTVFLGMVLAARPAPDAAE